MQSSGAGMDLRGPRHYVAVAMEWLLIFSAMLSAVTGALPGARESEARVAPPASAVASVRAAAEIVEQTAGRENPIPANRAPVVPVRRPAEAAPAAADPLATIRLDE